MYSYTRSLVQFVIALSAVAVPVQAQDTEGLPVRSFSELSSQVRPGERLIISAPNGIDVTGRLDTVVARRLVLDVGGVLREFDENDVVRVQRYERDSLLNGVLIGAAVANLPMAAALLFQGCEGNVGGCSAAVAVLAGIGGAIGAGVDVLVRERRTLFLKGPGEGGSRLLLVPIIGFERRGVGLILRF